MIGKKEWDELNELFHGYSPSGWRELEMWLADNPPPTPTALGRYLELQLKMLAARAEKDEAKEDSILDMMDFVWFDLSPEERELVNRQNELLPWGKSPFKEKYSILEIDRMREALWEMRTSHGPYNEEQVRRETEEEIRTHMYNGTRPEELEMQAKELQATMERWRKENKI